MSEPSFLVLPELLDLWQQTLSWSPTAPQQSQFQALLTQLCDLNKAVNLTRITDPEAFWEKHLWDSLWGIQPWLVQAEATINAIDIGSGGGFPGLPIAISQPLWHVTLLDSTRKKVTCLEALAQNLSLPKVHPVCDRAETLGQTSGYRANFDLALVRAVGPVSSCAEYAIPFLKVGGTAILYRGQWSAEEEQILQRALPLLGSELVDLRTTITPLTQAQRHCLCLRKLQRTSSQFPRKVGLPTQFPLGTVD
jgi:16S rRNA (guanine527-N7)-methyltransferase